VHYLIVDGHSILHAWPELKLLNRTPGRRNAARELLLQSLRHYQDMTRTQVVVVFDGTTADTTEQREPAGLQIFFASKAATADSIIEKLVTRHAATYRMTVATADTMIRHNAEAAGAFCISPLNLLTEVEQAESSMRKQIKGPAT
jgi:uncharacterized protein